jgi:hypothetical protein
MEKLLYKVVTFPGILKSCISETWREADSHYHIPKSRFKDPGPVEESLGSVGRQEKPIPRNAFLGSFRGCVAQAWEEVDTKYYIPKSRFGDPEYNQTAYRASQVRGVRSRVGNFFKAFENCISLAWEESDHFYYLPKSRYQDPVYLRGKMETAPKPKDRLVMRPLTIGMGVAGESVEEGWLAKPSQIQPDEQFIVPDDGADISSNQEVVPE